jgi:single-strand DNA-binding protein
MSDINIVMLVGRLVEKPVIKYSATGKAICNFRIANNIFIPGKDGAENKTKVNYVSVFCFGHRAESCEKHLDKGSMVGIQGRLDYQEWETTEGQKRSIIKIYAGQIQFLNYKKKDDQKRDESKDPEPEPEYPDEEEVK